MKKKIVFVVEVDRCIGCKGCQIACKMFNNTALGTNRIQVKTIGPIGEYPNIQMYFLPAMCQQCENPSCVSVCPTGASYIHEEDGSILIDPNLCIGCKSCHSACPYQINTFNEELRIMDKCTMCIQRRENGEIPMCVKNCCGEALHVGDINDPDSEVSRILREAGEENIYFLRDFGNAPAVRYILKNDKWIDVLPQECFETRRGRKHER
ncbi:MAG: 4Fe-4S dicluster domain-containing protein [Clostridia bacterium]|nr:4Fe-4S dicluster domain-containing protein [Clostridia bacterium]